MTQYILAIDQGTTSSRAVVFTSKGQSVASHQIEFTQHYPNNGWVEHDPEDIWSTTLECCQQAIQKARLQAQDIAAIGISNQRETTVIWDKKTGECIYPAIVWQDRRTASLCQELIQNKEVVELIAERTGLLMDPYFSATKIAWILNHVEGAFERAKKGELAFGTIDTFLIWRLTGGTVHATDATNASRTLLFNIRTQQWDDELLAIFRIPKALLPEVKDSNANFGCCDDALLGHAIPITGVLGDQQAATVGQACFKPGMIKSTYGTGCFVLLNTGDKIVQSKHRLLSTMAYRINGKATYGLEGSIFNAGTSIKWLRDSLHFFEKAGETEALASSITNNNGTYFVPAFTGLGAPHWDPSARGSILGLTRDSSIAHIVRAALEAVCYQTNDLIQAMVADCGEDITRLRVDGGMVANDWLLQFLSDILTLPIERPTCIETSALGAAYMAGLGAGMYKNLDEITQLWEQDRVFQPMMPADERKRYSQGWQEAIAQVLQPKKRS